MELVDLIKACNLSLVIIDNIFLFFLNVVDRSLNLGCQILLEYTKIVLLLLLLDPVHRLVLLFEDVYLLRRKLGISAASEEERKVFRVD